MKRVIVSSTAGLLLAGSVAAASAQSLADVARQEQERRKAIKEPSRVYTDADVQKAAPLTTAAARPGKEVPVGEEQAAAGHDTDKAAAPAKPADGKPAAPAADTEAAWRAKAQQAQEGLASSRRLLDALEQQAMRAAIDTANATRGGNPAPADPNGQGRNREMERLRRDIERYQNTLNSLPDEARRAGVPPGWVR